MKFLPAAPAQYSQAEQNAMRALIEKEVGQSLRNDQDVELVRPRIILRSPDGSRWALTVSNAGALSVVSA
jgi:hypothetical protein